MDKLQTRSLQLKDASSDQQTPGLLADVQVDRAAAARLGITAAAVDNTLYDAFGQRQVSTIYERYNQHFVILEVDPVYLQDPSSLQKIYVQSTNGAQVPLATIAKFQRGNTSLSVNHQGQFPAVTISFNLAPGVALGDATELHPQGESEDLKNCPYRRAFTAASRAPRRSFRLHCPPRPSCSRQR